MHKVQRTTQAGLKDHPKTNGDGSGYWGLAGRIAVSAWFGVFSTIAAAAAVVLLAGGALGAAVFSSHPATWVARDMLQALDPDLRAERQPVVDAALEAFPGGSETFLFALAGKDYFESLWAEASALWLSMEPGDAGSNRFLPGRSRPMKGCEK